MHIRKFALFARARKVTPAALLSAVLLSSLLLGPASVTTTAPPLGAGTAHAATYDVDFANYATGDWIRGPVQQSGTQIVPPPILNFGDTQVEWLALDTGLPTWNIAAMPADDGSTGNRRHYAYIEQPALNAAQTPANGYSINDMVISNNDPDYAAAFTFWCGDQNFSDSVAPKGQPGAIQIYDAARLASMDPPFTGTCNTLNDQPPYDRLDARPLGEISFQAAAVNPGTVGINQISFNVEPSNMLLGTASWNEPRTFLLQPNRPFYFPYYAWQNTMLNRFNIYLGNVGGAEGDSATYEFGLFDSSGSGAVNDTGGLPGELLTACWVTVNYSEAFNWYSCPSRPPYQARGVQGGQLYWIALLNTSESSYDTVIAGESAIDGWNNSVLGGGIESDNTFALSSSRPPILADPDFNVGRHAALFMDNENNPYMGNWNGGTGLTGLQISGSTVGYAQEYYAQGTGAYNTLGAYIQTTDPYADPWLAVVADNNGTVGALLGLCRIGTGPLSPGWYTCQLDPALNLNEGQPYWLAIGDAPSTPDTLYCANFDGGSACNNWMGGAGTSALQSDGGTSTGPLIGDSDTSNQSLMELASAFSPFGNASGNPHPPVPTGNLANEAEEFTAVTSGSISSLSDYGRAGAGKGLYIFPDNNGTPPTICATLVCDKTTKAWLGECNVGVASSTPVVESCAAGDLRDGNNNFVTVPITAGTKYWLAMGPVLEWALYTANANNPPGQVNSNPTYTECANNCVNTFGDAGISFATWGSTQQVPQIHAPDSTAGDLLIYGQGQVPNPPTWHTPTQTNGNLLLYADFLVYNDTMQAADSTPTPSTRPAVNVPSPAPTSVATPTAAPTSAPSVHVGPIDSPKVATVQPGFVPPASNKTKAGPSHPLSEPPGLMPLPKLDPTRTHLAKPKAIPATQKGFPQTGPLKMPLPKPPINTRPIAPPIKPVEPKRTR